MSSIDEGEDRYYWHPGRAESIEEYIKKNRPSIITSDITHWLWVRGGSKEVLDPEKDASKGEALKKAYEILEGLEKKLKDVEEDDSIPLRAKKGMKSKKQIRDEAHSETTTKLKELSQQSKWTCGKWLLFPKHTDVDAVWSAIAQSVAKGPLKTAGVFLAKVAPSPTNVGEGENPAQLICMYMEDVYDLDVVRLVLETLLTDHGIEPSAAKSDLYTLAGIDSNHPTKLRSSIWRPNEVIPGGNEAIKKMKEQYVSKKRKAQKGSPAKVGADGMIHSDSEDERISRSNKRKPPSPTAEMAKDEVTVEGKGVVTEIRSDQAGKKADTNGQKAGKAASVKRKKSAALKWQENDIFGGGSDTD